MQVGVESCGSSGIARLEGLWRLIWTTADDVRPLVATSRSPFSLLQVPTRDHKLNVTDAHVHSVMGVSDAQPAGVLG